MASNVCTLSQNVGGCSAWVDYDTHIWPYKEYRKRYGDKDKAPQMFREGVDQADKEYDTLPLVSDVMSEFEVSCIVVCLQQENLVYNIIVQMGIVERD